MRVEAAVAFDHAVGAFYRVASGVGGCPLGGSVGVALVVVDLIDAECDHPVAAVFGVGYGDDGLVGGLGAVGPVGVAGFGGGHDSARALRADDLDSSVLELLDDPPAVFLPLDAPIVKYWCYGVEPVGCRVRWSAMTRW